MARHLFLEGPIQMGKSTLIRELLGEHLKECGGFTSQRLVDANGQTIGFRIGPAAVTELTAPVAGMRPGPAPAIDPAAASAMDSAAAFATDPEGTSSRSFFPPLPEYLLTAPDGSVYNGVFKYFDRMGHTHKDQEIFDVLGTYYLTATGGTPLILLDEIGGSELLSDPFRNALYSLLASDIPCLGVLKLAESARHMQRAYGFEGPSIVDRNLELRRQILEDFGGQILYYQRTESGDSPEESVVRSTLNQFIGDVFSV